MTTATAEQRIASVLRQIAAVAAVVMGALTASVSALHLPAAVSSVLVVVGGVVLAVEHYVSDPSTGTSPPASSTATTTTVPVPPPPPAPVLAHVAGQ